MYVDERIQIEMGDITSLEVDAIVNAANKSLLGGGGVDGAIHTKAGPDLLDECQSLGGCETGQAKLTGGYRLPASHIIHTVGPVWHGGDHHEDESLAACYRSCLELAVAHDLTTIAFPAISTGAYRFPVDRAVSIAVITVNEFLADNASLEKVVFCCFKALEFGAYQRAVTELMMLDDDQ